MHVSELDTPALVVDLDILERNIREMASYCGDHGLALRPHIKTHKVPAVAKMQIAAGARGITVAKLGEAELMAGNGVEDILVAYPIVGAPKLRRLVALSRHAALTVATDSLEVAQGISQAAAEAGAKIRVLAEMDAGLRRCGVQSTAELVELAHGINRLPGVEFEGFMFFPGHVRAVPEQQPALLREIDERLAEAQGSLFRSGVQVKTVSGGSTPTAFRSHLMKTLTEIRPGTYVYNDMNTVTVGAADLAQCAVTVHTTVVSNAVRGRVVVDGGSKTFSSDPFRGGDGRGFGYAVEYPDVTLESMSEEHGHVDVSRTQRAFRIGERVRFIPNHVCTTVNLHSDIWGVRGDTVVEQWKVEGRGLLR